MGFSAIKSGLAAAVLLAAGWSQQVSAGQVTVAVASNFTMPMKALAAQFRQQSGHQLTLAYGSSGKIFAQLNHGAPFDVFLSADQDKPLALELAGLTQAGSRFTYAIGALALWSPRPGGLLTSADVLKKDNGRVAIANPKLAPYGAAAMTTLEGLGLYQQLGNKLVRGENIAQTYQFVASGNVAWGFVALSQVMQNGQLREGSAWPVPVELHQPIRQDGVVLKSAADNPAAADFVAFLKSDTARAMIRDFGYQTPEG